MSLWNVLVLSASWIPLLHVSKQLPHPAGFRRIEIETINLFTRHNITIESWRMNYDSTNLLPDARRIVWTTPSSLVSFSPARHNFCGTENKNKTTVFCCLLCTVRCILCLFWTRWQDFLELGLHVLFLNPSHHLSKFTIQISGPWYSRCKTKAKNNFKWIFFQRSTTLYVHVVGRL